MDNRAFADDDDDDDEPAPAPAKPAPVPPSRAGATGGPKAGPGKKDAAQRQVRPPLCFAALLPWLRLELLPLILHLACVAKSYALAHSTERATGCYSLAPFFPGQLSSSLAAYTRPASTSSAPTELPIIPGYSNLHQHITKCLCPQTLQEEFRRNKLQQETDNRARMRALKARLELGLRALGQVVEQAPRHAATHLEAYQELCLPLMSSWLVGEWRKGAAVRVCKRVLLGV